MINPIKLEYIWLDGTTPEPSLRSKTKIVDGEQYPNPMNASSLPNWFFDGSSTNQAETRSSDCMLVPVKSVPDPERMGEGFLVMCEVYGPDGKPHASNTRSTIKHDDDSLWFGFEQEYFLYSGALPVGWPAGGYPAPQGPYYCGVGSDKVNGRGFVENHVNQCLAAGLTITGINAEVALGQWEYQLLGVGAKNAADELWLSRYLLFRLSEKFGVRVELHPKPIKGDWNGSGMHANFSNKKMREKGGESYFNSILDAFARTHQDHIDVYGSDNDQRLTGKHETAPISEFRSGVSNRGASIRIPPATAKDWKGYLEDRRPASNADPYKVVNVIAKNLNQA